MQYFSRREEYRPSQNMISAAYRGGWAVANGTITSIITDYDWRPPLTAKSASGQ